MNSKYSRASGCVLQVLVVSILIFSTMSLTFDFDKGNAADELIVATVLPLIPKDVSPRSSDPSLIFRITTMTSLAWFDAIAPYHPTAIGVYTQHNHRLIENTNRNKNIACAYAGYHIALTYLPNRKMELNQMMTDVGLDPNLDSSDVNTPEGLGIIAAKNLIQRWNKDGMNQLGDKLTKHQNKAYNRQPYSDYTRYTPVNTAYELRDPNRWQPNIVTQKNGIFRVQQFVTPQYGEVTPTSYKTADFYKLPRPQKSLIQNWKDYEAQAKLILDESANLTLEKKLKAEFFDNKFASVGEAIHTSLFSKNRTVHQYVFGEVVSNLAGYDTGIAIWREKRRHDSVRPFSAIRFIFGNRTVTAWGGPGKGTVSDIPASQWRAYLDVADHPEYPSGSSAFCAAIATASRLFFQDDNLNHSYKFLKGTSNIEPGISPPNDFEIKYKTWTDLMNECGQTRIWGGVHFPDAVAAGRLIGEQIGKCAYRFTQAHISGRLIPTSLNDNCKY